MSVPDDITKEEIEDYGKFLYEAYNAWIDYGEAAQRHPEGATLRILMKLVRHNAGRLTKMTKDAS